MAGISKQIRMEKWVSSIGGTGDYTEAVTKYNCFGEVMRTGGSKSSTNGQTVLSNSMKLRVRFRPDFKPSGNWRVVVDGLRYTVESIEKEDGRRFWWIITTKGSGVQR